MKKVTTDHGEIIHLAGFRHLFPVGKKTDAAQVRLAADGEVGADEVRVGWPAYFRPFIDRDLVFLYDESTGQAATRAEADAARPAPAARPGGASSSQA
ncbi:MAG: hypothetical protein NVS4B10_17840 [Myxococcales bacterium]